MTKPPTLPSRSRKRSRLFQAAPEALFVEEWVPNITLPPPPDAPLEEEEGVAQLDEHGLPERSEDEEEPEEERRGPVRVYVGKGAQSDTQYGHGRDELPASDVEMPDLRLPSKADADGEDDSDPSMPDLSIDGSGSDWGAMFDALDDDEPTDPELRSGSEGEDSEPMPMPAAAAPAMPEPPPLASAAPSIAPAASEPVVITPKTDHAPPKLDRPRSAATLDARSTPSWTRPAKSDTKPPLARSPKPQPPRIRATQPKPPEPGIGSLVPRSVIIAVVLLVILMLVVLFAQRTSNEPPSHDAPKGPPLVQELTIQPGTMNLEPEPEPPAHEPPAHEPPATAEGQPEPVPVAAPTPKPPTVVTYTPRPSRIAPTPEPEPDATQVPERTPPPIPEEDPVAEPGGVGFMVVESDRYAMIYMGGRRLGGTPIARMGLEPGSYAVRAVCRDTGATKTMQIEVSSGDLATASFRFMP